MWTPSSFWESVGVGPCSLPYPSNLWANLACTGTLILQRVKLTWHRAANCYITVSLLTGALSRLRKHLNQFVSESSRAVVSGPALAVNVGSSATPPPCAGLRWEHRPHEVGNLGNLCTVPDCRPLLPAGCDSTPASACGREKAAARASVVSNV